ncbi:MAG: carboxypeptidase-like regulatory domain-containing protein [Bacteroidetes bacterium]|nr:carboxypeptidase-like regulatory domain-containing protein [Bacteroidota bacterium]MDA1121755.1 carboxypeptidase-like regulatory domain-containing protein [Bacteroidota bacterium]
MKKFLLINLMLLGMVSYSWAQDRSVSGRISSGDDGSGLPGVNVVVKGTTTGTITDFDGNYKLSLADDATTLVFTYIGFTTQEIEIGARSVIDVAMAVDVTELSEIVVTAVGIERNAKELSYSVTTVGNEELTQSRQNNVLDAIQGRVPGAQIQSASGAPGASQKILLRGSDIHQW